MSRIMVIFSFVFSTSAFAASSAQPPQRCIEQAKQAALALEQVFIAPSNVGSLSGSAFIVGEVTETGAGGGTRWVIPITFVIPVVNEGSNSTSEDTYKVTLGQTNPNSCYHIKTTSIY